MGDWTTVKYNPPPGQYAVNSTIYKPKILKEPRSEQKAGYYTVLENGAV